MIRASWLLCACLATSLVGCVFNIGGTRVDFAVKVDEQSLDVALDTAAARLQQELQRRGLEVAVVQDAQAVRVVSATRSGGRFTIILTRELSPAGKEQTRARVEWETTPDKELWTALIVALGSAALAPR